MLGLDFSTKLSAYLSIGSLTARQVHWSMMYFEKGVGDQGRKASGFGRGENEGTNAVRFELLWRDYMRMCAKKFGSRMFDLHGIREYDDDDKDSTADDSTTTSRLERRKQWRYLDRSAHPGDNPVRTRASLQRFLGGQTGAGLIDASQRELFLTGYTSNRARQNVASFLTSHLGIDWRAGAEWYESLLVDYDMASNWGNWQYVAGVGNDPRQGRVFNPVKQAFDYDGRGDYVRAWVPQLRGIGAEHHDNADDVNKAHQERLMGLFQAWRLGEDEKDRLGLRGVEWVEKPLVKIPFTISKGRDRPRRNPRGTMAAKGRGKR